MTTPLRSAATALTLLALAACSPRVAEPRPPTATADATPTAAAADSAALPASCRSLLATMQSCSDNLTRSGSPLADHMRASIVDMRNAIAAAPPAETSSFCDVQASAFTQLAQAYRC